MKIQSHPYISKKLTKLFAITFLTILALISLCIYGNRFIPQFEANHYFIWLFSAIWLLFIYFFATVWLTLKRVTCPHCAEKTISYSKHNALPDNHSAYCIKCDTLWDLGVGNSTSD